VYGNGSTLIIRLIRPRTRVKTITVFLIINNEEKGPQRGSGGLGERWEKWEKTVYTSSS
jgi:hypothetical protein